MSNKILLKRSDAPNAVPSLANVSLGELAINTVDGKLYTKIDDGLDEQIFELTKNQLITLGGDVTGSGTSNISVLLNANQSNITSVGNLTSLTVVGAIAGSNVSLTGNLVAAGNITGEFLIANTAVIANVQFDNITTGNITASGFANIAGNVLGGNIITVGNVDATGNVAGDFFIGNGRFLSGIDTTLISNGATEVRTYENGNVAFTINGVANVVLVTPDGITVVGNTDSGNLNATTATLSTANVSGNVNSGNVNTGFASITGNVDSGNVNTTLVTATTANVSGNVNSGNVNTTLVSATTANITANVNSGNVNTVLVSATTVDATGNVNSGNVNTGFIGVSGDAEIGGNITTGNGSGGNITGANVISANTVTASANVNAAGATVSGNITGGNIATAGAFDAGSIASATTITAVGNITGGNLNTAGLTNTAALLTTGNANVGNLGTAGQVTATGNITGGNVNSVGSVNAVGNVNGSNLNATANITGGNVIASANINGGNVNTNKLSTLSGDIEITTGAADGNVYLLPTGSGNVILGSDFINGVRNPLQAQDAATKQYVDDAVSTGITIHEPVQLLACGNCIGGTYAQGGTLVTVEETIAGNTVVFSGTPGLQVNDQLWFENSFNGVEANVAYFVASAPNTSAAVLTRTYSGEPVTDITSGSSLTQSARVNSGQGATLTNSGTNAVLIIDGVTTEVGFRVLLETQANAVTNGVYVVTTVGDESTPWVLTRSADMDTYIPDDINGLDSGDYFFVELGDNNAGEAHVMTAPVGPVIIGFDELVFTLFAASQVYTANTAAGIDLTGTVFSAKVDDDTTAFDGLGNIIVKAGANLVTPNIGSATGTSLTVTGNVDSGNLNVAANVIATGNVTGDYLLANNAIIGDVTFTNINTGNITATGFANIAGNVTGGNIVTSGLVDAGAVTSATTISATGNITGGNLISNGKVVATGNVSGANINTVGLTSSGTLLVTANANVGNLGTAGQVSATGNITGGNLIAVGNLVGLQYQSTNLTLLAPTIGNTAGERVRLYDFADPAKTNYAIGVETSAIWMGVDTNLEGQGFKWYGSNVQVARLSGVGNLTISGNLVANANITGANLNTTGVTNSGTLSVTGDANVGNLGTAGFVVATGNITGGNFLTGGLISAVGTITGIGNVSGGNLLTGGLIQAVGNITGGNVNTAGQVVAIGNITGGNIISVGNASVTGNIAVGGILTDGYFYANGTPVDFEQPAGSNTEVQFNFDSDFGASANFTFDSDTNILTLTGNIDTTNINATGNVAVGNVNVSEDVVATGTITGGNLITTGAGNIATLTVSTLANITAATAATSNVTGALIVAGGAGFGSDVYASDIYSNGDLVLTVESTVDGGSY
jgi:hypothetical protein